MRKTLKQFELPIGFAQKPEASLVMAGKDAALLSKEQKRFNQLVRRIKRVREEMEDCRKAQEELRVEFAPRIIEAEKVSIESVRQLVLALDGSQWRLRLPKKLRKKLSEILMQEITSLLRTPALAGDARLNGLFEEYEPDHVSFDEVSKEDDQLGREMASDMMRDVLGMDVPPQDLDDEAKMHAHFERLKQQHAEKGAAFEKQRAARQARKKKTARQLETEQRREEAESALKKTTRQIYLDLVKHYHPDREQDEALRHEKTEWMKQITAAYEADDHLKLLELQMTLLADRENAYAGFEEAHLKHFNQALQRQLAQLEADLHFLRLGNPGDPMAGFFHPVPKVMKAQVRQHTDSLIQGAADRDEHRARFTISEAAYRGFIRDFALEDDFFDDFDLPPGFF